MILDGTSGARVTGVHAAGSCESLDWAKLVQAHVRSCSPAELKSGVGVRAEGANWHASKQRGTPVHRKTETSKRPEGRLQHD